MVKKSEYKKMSELILEQPCYLVGAGRLAINGGSLVKDKEITEPLLHAYSKVHVLCLAL